MNRIVSFCIPLWLAVTFIIGLGVVMAPVAVAQGSISLRATYTDIAVSVDTAEVEIPVTVTNAGQTGKEVRLSASGPTGWEIQFESAPPTKVVRGIYLPAQEADEDDNQQELTFKVTPSPDADIGNYDFQLIAASSEGTVYSSLDLTIGLIASSEIESRIVELSADTTIIEQESGRSFKFDVQLKNGGTEDHWFEFFAEQTESGTPVAAATGWEVSVTESRGGDKIINLLVKAGQSKQLEVTLEPMIPMPPGEYSILFGASSDDGNRDRIQLTAKVTGTYELDIHPPEEDPRLNFSATAGKAKHITLVVENIGSTNLQNISFFSRRIPSEWSVTFTPDMVESLEIGDSRKVDIAVEPSSSAIAGDYMIGFEANGYNCSDTIEYRVKVETSSAWGWIGITIVIVVILGLFGIFYKLRRR